MLVCSSVVPVDKGPERCFVHSMNNVVKRMSVLAKR